MSLVTFHELIREVPLSVEEAVALALGADDALREHRFTEAVPSLPDDTEVTLSRDGSVTIRSLDRRTLSDEVTQLGALLRRLLRLDEDSHGRRRRVPGALVVLIARSVGHIDAPPPSPDAFRSSLLRFAGSDPAAVRAAIYHRTTSAASEADAVQSVEAAPIIAAPIVPTAIMAPHRAATADAEQQNETAVSEEFEVPPAAPDAAVPPAAWATTPVASYRRRGARQWLAGGSQAALAIGGAALTTLVLVTLGEQGLFDGLRPTPVNSTAAAEMRGTTGVTATDSNVSERTDRSAARVAPAASTRVVPSRVSGTPAEILDAALVGRDAFSPSYTHDGKSIYFHAGRNAASLMRASIDGDGRVTDVATVLDDGASNYHVTASPDGAQIAFDSDRGGVRGIYVARSDGGGARRVSGSGYAAVPTWSPDGRRLAFIKGEPGRRNVWNVWVVDLRGGALHRVTSHTSGQAWGASWFPDGKRLAYSRERQLVIADLTAGTATAIGSPVPGHLVRTPAVSPDGARVIFQVHGDGAWMLDVARQRVRRVLGDRSAEEFVWSPDGHHIAYHAVRDGRWGVWTMASGS